MNDMKQALIRYYRIRVKNIFDIRYMAKMAEFTAEDLKKLTEKHLKVMPFKKYLTTSPWELPLTERHSEYAANNAHISMELFKFFAEKLKSFVPFTNHLSYVQYIINEYCSNYLNLNYTDSDTTNQNKSNDVENEIPFYTSVHRQA